MKDALAAIMCTWQDVLGKYISGLNVAVLDNGLGSPAAPWCISEASKKQLPSLAFYGFIW